MAGVHSVRDKLRLRDTSGHFKTIESYNFQYHWYGLSSRNSTIFIVARCLFYWTSLVYEAKYIVERDIKVCVN